jgi:UrcA family protein
MNTSTLNTSKFIHSPAVHAMVLTWLVSLAGIAGMAVVLCLLSITPAWSASPDSRSVTVSFRDLDISTPAGAKALYGRIQSAAKQVCGYQGADLIEQSIWRSCYRNAISDAVGKVNSPLLTAVHTGRPPQVTAMLSK